MAGVRLTDGATAIWFGAIGPAVTRSVLPTLPASPPNGRADNHEAAGGRLRPARRGNRRSDDGQGSGAWATTPEAATAVVVTVAGGSGALPGTGGGSVKVTPFAEYPPKGRATGGVRCSAS